MTERSDDHLTDLAETDAAPQEHAGLPAEPEASAIQRLERELDETRDRQLRLAAEFDNYRKRVTRERSELTERAQAGFIARLLDVLDDLDRLAEGDPATSAESLREAVGMIDRKFRKELEGAGIERIAPDGQPFDPAEHEAVAAVPAPSEAEEGLVAAVFQPGYRFKGQLLRPARVQVYSDHGSA